MKTVAIQTKRRVELVDITSQVAAAVREAKVESGICVVFCPHTTAGITINENADPDVVRDLIVGLERLAPAKGDYLHSEGNSDAHIKSSLVGSSQQVIVENGSLALGTWQGIYFCEFDGPRHRKFDVKIIGQ